LSDRTPRFGVKIPFYPPELAYSVVEGAERLGLDSAWSADHLVAISTKSPECLSSWSLLGALAVKTDRLLLGSSVSDPCRFHPALVAQMVMTMYTMTRGRFVLGIGAGEAQNTHPYGIECSNPIRRLHEFVTVVRRLLEDEEEVTYDGEFYTLDKAAIRPQLPRGALRIWLGANSPRTIRMTGELGDGWLPMATVFPPADYRSNLAEISRVAARAGRDAEAIEPALFTHIAIAKTEEEAVKMAEVPGKLQLLGWTPQLFGGDVGEADREAFHFKSFVFNSGTRGKLEEMLRKLPSGPVRERAVVGTPAQCIDKIGEYVDAGVRHFVASLMCPPDRLLDSLAMYKQVVSHFR
jgi:phthiodiolone/phenolphthiodiolone dimycocerosates ketoreductase